MTQDFQTIFRVKDPFVFNVFGASGDLAKLKIFPALFALAEQSRFPKEFLIVGYARTQMTQEEFRKIFMNSVKDRYEGEWGNYQNEVLEKLLPSVCYFSGQYDRPDDFRQLKNFLSEKITNLNKIMQVSYFSVPPFVVEPIMKNLAEIFEPEKNDLRLILEKPFGDCAKSAQKLFRSINALYRKDQVYLLDHYLGKKAVRSLIPLRNMNRILNSMLKGTEISNIQISALEPMGVGERIGYFDQVGTIKDVVQSHLLQVFAMLGMSIPIDASAERIQEERASILSALEFIPEKNNISLGQYQEYQSEDPRVKDSQTETFAAVRLRVNRETWFNVPIFLRTGKRLNEKHTFLVVELKKFEFQDASHEPNRVIIEFYPNEMIQIRLLDEDGATMRQGEIAASESIACYGDYCLPEHGLLLLDVIRGEKRYFLSMEEIIASWQIVDSVMNFIAQNKIKPEVYKSRSRGPKNQKNLMKGTTFSWYDPHSK